MDARMARQQLREVNEQLARLDEEREVLLSLVKGYEGWLRLHGRKEPEGNSTAHKPVLIAHPPTVSTTSRTAAKGAKSKPPARTLKGTISLRKAVLQVVREAHGEPVHVLEILARASALGAVSEAKSPDKIIDLVAYNLKSRGGQPLERVSPRSWRWTGE